MWMGLAATATYFLDPDRGVERRRDLRKRIAKMRSAGEHAKLDTSP